MAVSSGEKYIGNMKSKRIAQDIANGESVDLPASTKGFGIVLCGDEFAIFTWKSTGIATLQQGTSLIDTSDVPNKLCFIDTGSIVSIKNNLGATKRLKYFIAYR